MTTATSGIARSTIEAFATALRKGETMKAREIDKYILACPCFMGKDCVDRKIFDNGLTHVGACSLEWNYDKVCPSSKCICAEIFGLERRDDEIN